MIANIMGLQYLYAMRRAVLVVGLLGCGPGGDGRGSMVTVHSAQATSAVVAHRHAEEAWVIEQGGSLITFEAASGRYSVAIACVLEGRSEVIVYEATIDDTQEIVYDRLCQSGQSTISGSVSGSDASGLLIAWGAYGGGRTGSLEYAVSVRAGTSELVAIDDFAAPTRALIRTIEVPANQDVTGADIDLAGAESFALDEVVLDIPGGDTQLSVVSSLIRQSGTRATVSGGPFKAIRTIPTGHMTGGDLHRVSARLTLGGIGDPIVRTSHSVVVLQTPTASSISNLATINPTSQPVIFVPSVEDNVLLRAEWPEAAGHHTTLDVENWRVHASASVMDEGAIALPDLHDVVGWPADIGIPNGFIDWSVRTDDGPFPTFTLQAPTTEMTSSGIGWAGSVSTI